MKRKYNLNILIFLKFLCFNIDIFDFQVLKLVNDGKMEAEQEVQLYLMILELQEKNEAILEVLSGPLAHHLSQVPEMKARLLLKLKRYPEAISSFKNLISKK